MQSKYEVRSRPIRNRRKRPGTKQATCVGEITWPKELLSKMYFGEPGRGWGSLTGFGYDVTKCLRSLTTKWAENIFNRWVIQYLWCIFWGFQVPHHYKYTVFLS